MKAKISSFSKVIPKKIGHINITPFSRKINSLTSFTRNNSLTPSKFSSLVSSNSIFKTNSNKLNISTQDIQIQNFSPNIINIPKPKIKSKIKEFDHFHRDTLREKLYFSRNNKKLSPLTNSSSFNHLHPFTEIDKHYNKIQFLIGDNYCFLNERNPRNFTEKSRNISFCQFLLRSQRMKLSQEQENKDTNKSQVDLQRFKIIQKKDLLENTITPTINEYITKLKLLKEEEKNKLEVLKEEKIKLTNQIIELKEKVDIMKNILIKEIKCRNIMICVKEKVTQLPPSLQPENYFKRENSESQNFIIRNNKRRNTFNSTMVRYNSQILSEQRKKRENSIKKITIHKNKISNDNDDIFEKYMDVNYKIFNSPSEYFSTMQNIRNGILLYNEKYNDIFKQKKKLLLEKIKLQKDYEENKEKYEIKINRSQQNLDLLKQKYNNNKSGILGLKKYMENLQFYSSNIDDLRFNFFFAKFIQTSKILYPLKDTIKLKSDPLENLMYIREGEKEKKILIILKCLKFIEQCIIYLIEEIKKAKENPLIKQHLIFFEKTLANAKKINKIKLEKRKIEKKKQEKIQKILNNSMKFYIFKRNVKITNLLYQNKKIENEDIQKGEIDKLNEIEF